MSSQSLPFHSLRKISNGRPGSYIIGIMFTPSYAHKAARLAASCEKFGLPYVMHEVAAVHRSISSRGTADATYTKANFIHHLLSEHQKPVLYVDADCEIVSPPELIETLVKSGNDFAIYNWLSDEHTDAFAPVEINISNGTPVKKRFYAFTHRIDYFATDQLMCSGMVQFYANTEPARFLLSEWLRVVMSFPGCADDECLDFACNNMEPPPNGISVRWLPKAYARYSWWIYAKPVINHPEFPNEENNFIPIADPAGRKRFYPARAKKRTEVRLFPTDCIVDTQDRLVCEMVGNRLVVISPTDQNFWL